MNTIRTLAAVAAALACVSATPTAQSVPPRVPSPVTLSDVSSALEALSQKVGPAVVQIFVTGYTPGEGIVTRSAELLPRDRTSGSGVIVDPDGYIVTNAHVVEGATRVEVDLPVGYGEKARDARRSILRGRGRRVGAQVVAIDDETDVAVLKVAQRGLPFLPFGDSDDLRPGQLVLAFGSPLGLANSVSMGVVSAVARQLEPEDPMIYVQTDAPINPGNSGGALVDTQGRLVGINTMILSQGGGDEGIGFAAPSNIVRNIFEQVRQHGRVRRGDIGVVAQTVTPILATGLGLPQDWGVILADVVPRGAADRAGLRVGDLVLQLDRKEMENGRQFTVNIYSRPIGQRVSLTVLRGKERLTVPVEVGERPNDPSRFASLVNPGENLIPRLGVLVLTLDDKLTAMLPPLRHRDGVLVAASAEEASQAEGEFVPGDVIYGVNGARVRTVPELRAAIAALKSGEAVVVQIEREGQLRYLALEID